MRQLFIKFILILFGWFSSTYGELPEQYEKKAYTKEEATKVGRRYYFTYGFRDHLGAYREFKWDTDSIEIESFLYRFGLNEKHTEKFHVGKTELEYSMMMRKGSTLVFDYNKIVEESRPLVKNLYLKFKVIADQYKLSKREKVEFVMRFLQDIPYGIPPDNYKGRYIAGLFPPMEILVNTWGDCDSKSVLMASLLSLDEELFDKMAVITVPGHALLGFKFIPGPYEKYVEYRGEKYIYAEPVGLSRSPLGKTNSPYSHAINVHPLTFSRPMALVQAPSGASHSNNTQLAKSVEGCPENGLSVEYDHPFNGEHIKTCQIKVAGKYIKHGPTRYFSKDGQLLREEMYDRGQKI